MRLIALSIAALSAAIIAGGCGVTIEEAKYKVVSRDRNYEIREYAPHVIAETVVEGTLEDAGNKAFNRLFAYISGKNRSRGKIAMTAPVSGAARSAPAVEPPGAVPAASALPPEARHRFGGRGKSVPPRASR